MMLLILVFLFFALGMLGMAVGVLVGRKPLEGGCGQSCKCLERR